MNAQTTFGGREIETDTRPARKALDPYHYQTLADEFLMSVGTTYRYYQGQSYRYDGTKYVVEPNLAVRLRMFLMSRKIPQNNNVIGNVVPIVQTRTFCDEAKYRLPFFFRDAPADPRSLISYRNGLLNVDQALKGDHALIRHTPDFVSLTSLPYDYDPGVGCPRWLAFLDEVLDGDAERIALLQEWFGYCLTNDASQQKAMILKGVPRAGKGTTVSVLEAVLGSENVAGYTLNSLAERFGMGSLLGKLVAVVGEVNLQKCREKYSILERFNMIVGCDPVEIEFKFNATITTTRLPVKFVISCNEFPNFADTSGALAERLLVVDFEKSVPPERRDPQLAAKLLSETAGINNWALTGLGRLRSQGFTVPGKMKATVNTIRREASHTMGFLQDALVVHQSLGTNHLPGVTLVDTDTWLSSKDLGEEYCRWCGDNEFEPNYNYLGRNLRTILPKLTRQKRSMAWGYPGLGVKRSV